MLAVIAVDGAKGGFRCKDSSTTPACLPSNYSKFELPIKSGVNRIGINIHIDEVLRINDKDYSITSNSTVCSSQVDEKASITYWHESDVQTAQVGMT